MGDFCGTRIEGGIGPVGITVKTDWADYEQLLRPVFSCFHGQNIVASAVKNCIK